MLTLSIEIVIDILEDPRRLKRRMHSRPVFMGTSLDDTADIAIVVETVWLSNGTEQRPFTTNGVVNAITRGLLRRQR